MRCLVPGCSSSVSTQFHSFPLNNEALCRSWLRSVQNPLFGADADFKVLRQQSLKVCSNHFAASDYMGSCLKESAVPTVFPWTGIRVELLSQRVKVEEMETSEIEDRTVASCSQLKEDAVQKASKSTQTPDISCILKRREMLVNTHCLLELFKFCSMCLVECGISVKGNDKRFSVIQDCQSCGHHRVWRSHPTPAEAHVEASQTQNKDHNGIIQEEHKHLKDEDASSHPKIVELVPPRVKIKEVPMEIKQTIVSLRNQKKSIRKIGQTVGLSKSTVAYILKKKASTGDLANRKRPGRPKKTTDADDQIILSIMTKNPQTSVQQMKNILKEIGRELSAATIRRKLHSLNHSLESAFLHNMMPK